MAMDVRQIEIDLETMYADAIHISDILTEAKEEMRLTMIPSEKRLFADSALRRVIQEAQNLAADAKELREKVNGE